MRKERNFGSSATKKDPRTRGRPTVQVSIQGRAVDDSGQATYAAAEAAPATGVLILDQSGAVVAATEEVRRICGYSNYTEGCQRRLEPELRNTIGRLLDPHAPLDEWSSIQLVLNGRPCQCWGLAIEQANRERLAVLLWGGLSTAPMSATLRSKQPLTLREQEVVVLLARGFTNKQIAARMRVSVNTVKAFLRSVGLKVGATTRAGIVGHLTRMSPNWANPYGVLPRG